jgi:ATP-dependent DNA helicase RecQ
MTRARTSLTLLAQGSHPFVRHAGQAILKRSVTPDASAVPELRKRYVAPDEKLVDLSYAGRLADRNPALRAIAAAQPGDPLHLVRDEGKWLIRNDAGDTLGRMAHAFSPPDDSRFLHGRVGAILRWRAEDGDEAYRPSLRRQEWEVVLPELVFRDRA